MRSTILNLEESKIRKVAIDSLHHGETFYALNLGLPYLRESLARAMSSKHSRHNASVLKTV